ncbi:disease resistance protein RUN1-like [Actinidia eriantha]|uniref:disease resistance protein RUN1-like n=1 Tax=Actinidia eriantha TaxID=165200 RepID=UPI002590B846|nr:disease resistance protein RUN1-like [Actinidia eriantha]
MATLIEAPKASSSSSEFKFNYDIFLSFRGLDTRKKFTDHLYHALNRAGFRTFRDDDEIRRSENINSELQRAIKYSKMSVIVFSEDYASSNACLFEVQTILEQCKKSDHFILPVFYDVDPGRVKEQARNMEKKDSSEKTKRRSAALKEVASMAGMVLQNQADGYEAKFIEKIVEELRSKLTTKRLRVPHHLIGMDSRTKDINLWFEKRSNEVGVLVICGMGGIGKTTIAKVVYNSNCGRFDATSFLTNIREDAKKPNGLVRLQRQLISDILRKEEHKVNDVEDGCRRLQYILTNKRVLLVLDDVDDEDQLYALFGQQEWFFPGSKVIITTRLRNLLNTHDEVYQVYRPEKLSTDEALELFSRHAFGENKPIQGYKELSEMFVQHCQGLPLALQVLGSSVRRKNLDIWKSTLQKLQALSDNKILEKLEISFDSLQDKHDKNVFLEIACFFVGKKKNDTITILDGCEYYTLAGIHNLLDRNLLTIENGKLGMHHLLQDMGKQIVSRESKYPEECSRIWCHKESFNILNEKNGTRNIEGLNFDLNVLKKDEFETVHHSEPSNEHLEFKNSSMVVFETTAFEKMCNLRLLKLSCVQLSGTYEALPKRLRWLYWRGFSSEYIPYDFPIENLVTLDMRYSNLKQVLKGAKVLGSLKMLNVSHSPKLAKTPDFSKIPCLEKLILKDCPRLIEVDESIVKLQRIFSLNLKDCKNLRKLPRNISMVQTLEELNISGCTSLIGAIEELKKMRSLRVLQADRMNVSQLLTMEVESQASFWPWIPKPRKSIQMSLAALPSSLVHLSLAHCNLTDDAFPGDLGMLSKLQHFCLVGNPISTLPNCVKDLTGLQTLDLSWCPNLRQILWPSIVIEELVVTECRKLEKITFEPSAGIKRISHGACMSLDYVERGFKILPVAKVDVELLNNIGFFNLDLIANVEAFIVNCIVWSRKKCPIQIHYENFVFSTYFPGREVPYWFSNKNAGSTLTFTMTSSPRRRILGVNLCLVYTVPEDIDWLPGPFHVKISNKSRNIAMVYTPRCYGIPEAGGNMVWLSHWLPETLFKQGDEVQILFGLNVDGQIKECGVHLLYIEEKKEIFQYYKTICCSWDSNMFRVVSVADGGQHQELDEAHQKQGGEEGSYGVAMKEKIAPERSVRRTSVVKSQSEEENALWRIEKLEKEKSEMEIRLSKDKIDAQHHKIDETLSQQGDESCRIQLLEKEKCELKIENEKKELKIHQLMEQMSKMKETMAAMQKQLHDAQQVALKLLEIF